MAESTDGRILNSEEDTKRLDLLDDGIDLLANGELAKAELLLAGFRGGLGSESELDL